MPDAPQQLLAASFERTVGDRLLAAERLTAWLPEILGGALGAQLAVRGGAKFIRIVVLGVVAALVLKLTLDLAV